MEEVEEKFRKSRQKSALRARTFVGPASLQWIFC